MGSTFERTGRASGMAARQRLATFKLGSALAALAAASLPALAIAAEEDLPGDDQIVVTATRTPLQIEDAPATITVIDDEQIADELATDIKDLVRYEPGVSVRRAPARFGAALGATGRARNEDFIIRGIGGNRVLIQVDGIRSPQGFSFGAQDAGRGGYTDVSLVKSVEILRGPASALYGSDGLAGAISFTTSDPVDLVEAGQRFGGFVRASYSSADEEFTETAAIAGLFGDLSAMLSYTRRDFHELENAGEVDGLGSGRTLPNPQDGTSNAFLGKLVWDTGAHRVRLSGEYLETEVATDVLSGQGPAFLFGPFPSWIVDDLTALDTTERGRLSIDWTYVGEGAIDYAHAAAYYQTGEDVQFTDEDRSPVSATPRPDRERLNTFENEVYGFSAEARSVFGGDAFRTTLAFGGDVSWTRQEGLRDGTEPPFGEVFPTRAFPATDFMLGGVFLATEFTFLDGAVTLFPALRYDFYDLDPTDDPLLPDFAGSAQSDDRLSPKLGVTVKLADDVLLYGNYAQGFRAPTPYQVNNFFENLAYGYTSLPNPDLGAETSESWEAGIKFSTEAVSLQIAAFTADYDDFISQQVVGGSFTPMDPAQYQFVNYDAVEIEGVEAKANFRMENGFYSRFAIAYADGDILSPGAAPRPLDTIDPLNLVVGIGYREPQGRFGGELIATHHARKPLDETDGGYRPDAFTILDATAFFAVTDAFKLRAGIFNIFDEKYAYWQDVRGLSATSTTTDAYTRPGRNASVSLSFQF
ncbi:TonB-dependent hemoglobin/transferrin/lactoferrin family receptor [Qipengyuania profunda]|jgi:hemoglobin/transferrin/lactoferrin receptor protein|uniref:TonB-dependent hemoglobin/transferrin/lactoferrin family receptor n=1 Tax=Qipengyuania profunda TaxID=3113984 RepID=UPI002A18B33E|nr:TonB-dependent hemoglobin/transferrin/lactoferrin family receptor [Qipengyuania sp. HL-TH1]WPL56709.1 TonB-dependent hemoglobin/transferrin/lactoferrin family receptor [Qipengyuania sp. HL-TH5]